MAFTVKNLSKKELSFVNKKCRIQKIKSVYDNEIQHCKVYSKKMENNESGKEVVTFRIPIGLWNVFYSDHPHKNIIFPKMKDTKFSRVLYTKETDPKKRKRDQQAVAAEALDELKTNGHIFLSLFTGFGKTMTATYLSCKLKYKTLVTTFNDIVRRQWKVYYEDCGAKVCVNPAKFDDAKHDVLICGVKVLYKVKNKSAFGTIIYDEAHSSTVEACKQLLEFNTRYLIGLSATPNRVDGLCAMLPLFFGKYIFRKETKRFTVVKYKTNYVPEVETSFINGHNVMNWSKVIGSVDLNESKIRDVCNIAMSSRLSDRCILIICFLKAQSNAIYSRLKAKGENAGLLCGTIKYDPEKDNYRILVCGMKKAGVGFDNPKYNAAIIASDVKNVIQYEGRVRPVDCIIYDVVDDFPTFENHWNIRFKWYVSKGATIEYQNCDPPTQKKKSKLAIHKH